MSDLGSFIVWPWFSGAVGLWLLWIGIDNRKKFKSCWLEFLLAATNLSFALFGAMKMA